MLFLLVRTISEAALRPSVPAERVSALFFGRPATFPSS
jgi:hypothetical protein